MPTKGNSTIIKPGRVCTRNHGQDGNQLGAHLLHKMAKSQLEGSNSGLGFIAKMKDFESCHGLGEERKAKLTASKPGTGEPGGLSISEKWSVIKRSV